MALLLAVAELVGRRRRLLEAVTPGTACWWGWPRPSP